MFSYLTRLAFLVFFSTASFASEFATPRAWDFRAVGQIPIHNDGRLMPLDTYARDVVLSVTGKRSYESWEPIELLFSWIAFPEAWSQRDIVRINHHELKRQLLVDEKQTKFTPDELFGNMVLMQYAQSLSSGGSSQVGMRTETKANPRSTELNRVLSGLQAYRAISSGEAWRVIPGPEGHWKPLRNLGHGENDDLGLSEEDKKVRQHFARLILAYHQADETAFQQATKDTYAAVTGHIENWTASDETKIKAESFYNRSRPFMIAWIFYLLGGVVYFLMALQRNPGFWWKRTGLGMLIVGFAFHVLGFVLRVYISGRPPVSNMYESIVWVSWGTLLFAFLLYWRTKRNVVLGAGAVVAAFSLIAADAAPAMMNPGINSLVPVLRSNYWLTIHVLTITLSYAAFALALGISNVTLWKYFVGEKSEVRDLNQLAYRATQFGVVLLAAGTILGGIWADESWGRFWGWDPKETWAFIALLVYVAVLHARLFGFIGQFGFAAWSVICFLSVVMAWYGVNFILGVGLHSYGFASGGTNYVLAGCGLQLLYVMAVACKHYGWTFTRR